MILTPIRAHELAPTLQRFASSLADGASRAAFARIARPRDALRAAGEQARRHHGQVLALAASVGMPVQPGRPQDGFSWDGKAARLETEAYVLVHEVAHFQLAAPERRRRADFGLGPGPETGDRAGAARQQVLFGLEREREEAMASLLGILWESELRQPALASFLDQNWLEGAGRPGTARHFEEMLARLRAGGFTTEDGRPSRRLRLRSDEA